MTLVVYTHSVLLCDNRRPLQRSQLWRSTVGRFVHDVAFKLVSLGHRQNTFLWSKRVLIGEAYINLVVEAMSCHFSVSCHSSVSYHSSVACHYSVQWLT